MSKILSGLVLICILLVGLATAGAVLAKPSAGFQEVGEEAFDDWGICRTRAAGHDGFYQISRTTFRPVIIFESLGENVDIAYFLGVQIAQQYPDPLQGAEAVFYFVRDRVRYTSDSDQFKYDEFAQNADELAVAIDQKGVAYGDCEDSAALLAVMYKGAGYRSAIALAPGHTASLVYLPDYKKATAVFDLKGESGWVWAEATGKNNPLGWVPEDIAGGQIAAYEVEAEVIAPSKPPTEPKAVVAETDKGSSSSPLPFGSILLLLWLLPLFRRRRSY